MKVDKMIVLRPFAFFVVVASVVLLLPSFLISLWIIKGKRVENDVMMISNSFHREILSGIDNAARILLPMNSSANNLARLIGAAALSRPDTPSFSEIETKVVPLMFQAVSTIPHLSQVSYIGTDGSFFSLYYKREELFAFYMNSSISASYIQPVNRDTGRLYGEAVTLPPRVNLQNESWIQQALNRENGYASLGYSWDNADDVLILNTAGINGKGVISLGFRLQSFVSIFSGVNLHGGSLYLVSRDGKVLIDDIPNTRVFLTGNCSVSIQLVKPNGAQGRTINNITCQNHIGNLQASIVNIFGKMYQISSSPLEVLGVPTVYVLALPYDGLGTEIHKSIRFSVTLLMLLIGAIVIFIYKFVVVMLRAARREMCLQAALIKQKEATQTAERKSMNKSLAFAKASHDIRNYLSGITGHIDISRDKVDPKSTTGTILNLIRTCTEDILGILNSILDASKIEAGKMQLEEKRFHVARLLEEVVDLFYPVARAKGVDVVLDLFDGSLVKSSYVKGDNGRLKQILSNLLSNAVKFTSEGHVSVRARAANPSADNCSVLASSTRVRSMRWLSCLFFKTREEYSDLEVNINEAAIQQVPNSVEFIFEVDDSGRGIPKDKQKSVFENYIQVKDANPRYQGTGLGLGIVQSLVRLMGGEITIVDKGVGEKGTCFRFNVFLTVCESGISEGDARRGETEAYSAGYVSRDSQKHSPGPSRVTNTPKRQESSRVVLFIHSVERQKMVQKSMEELGVKVSVVKHWEKLSPTLKNVGRQKRNTSSSSEASVVSGRSKEVPLSALDGTSYPQRGKPSFILIVVDISEGHFREMSRAVAEFRREAIDVYSRVVWLCSETIHLQGLDETKLPLTDRIITQPLHGSRLYQVIGLLPEFEGTFPYSPQIPAKPNPRCSSLEPNQAVNEEQREIQEVGETSSSREHLLKGKRILLAEDHFLQQAVAKQLLSKLGATVETCANGEEALVLMSKGLSNRRRPYDYILMDCQMPVMDGCEATGHIREEEKRYGVHTPIIALTGYAEGEELERMYRAGVDYHLTKPINREMFLDLVTTIHSRQ